MVINYKPLNHFLQDDKFHLPNTMTLFSCLHKFDLKTIFWQLGIDPEDRYKISFCIPDHHYQWRVIPLGLKAAPLLFQKAMIKVFKLMLRSTLIYIDDVLLFSKDKESHATLLKQIIYKSYLSNVGFLNVIHILKTIKNNYSGVLWSR